MVAFLRRIGSNRRRRPKIRPKSIQYQFANRIAKDGAFLAAMILLLDPTAAKADSGGDAEFVFLFLILFVIAWFLYFLPTIIAFRKEHPNRWVILALNAFLGSTIVVWILCLIWANKAIHLSSGAQGSEGTDGGESGLNIFANDEKRVRIVNLTDISTHVTREVESDVPAQLSKLKSLMDSGTITHQEFADLKKKLLANVNLR